jgi:3-oxoacyl-[acyl-carrier-protein] synthase-3
LAAKIEAIGIYLPSLVESSEDLAELFPEWSSEKIAGKTGISNRHISGPNEFSSDLAVKAADALFEDTGFDRSLIDSLILITQTPDFILPSTSGIVHETLGLRSDAGSIDINQGCSGYVYGLAVAKGLIESNQAKNVLLITADTYTKLINPLDRSVRSIFGDGATATLLSNTGTTDSICGFIQGTNGGGAGMLIVPSGSLRRAEDVSPNASPEKRGLIETGFDLYMDGPGIFNFTLEVVGDLVSSVLDKAGYRQQEIDFFVFHQANKFMLDHIIRKHGLPPERCPIVMQNWGNTVSSTIPMAIYHLAKEGKLSASSTLMLAGFGVGLSWAGITARVRNF